MNALVKSIIAAYVIAAFLTFGSTFNAVYVSDDVCGVMPDSFGHFEEYAKWKSCEFNHIDRGVFDASFKSFFAGVGWPIYWGAVASIKVTK